MTPTTPSALHLPAELTIYTATETRQAWLAWLAAEPEAQEGSVCRVDGAAVDQVDASGMQLLAALSRTLHEQQRPLQLVHASAPLLGACRALGMTALLQGDSLATGDTA